ncbi:MAG: geranylgeranylglyceryl/heptaprenylglyceryl phosphate synthase [Bacteroidales bacterium]|nr:geranylgeranylglyceryl/heptaprenylglyceryl phosphate synthase [Bacteroidales bacterium]
MSVYSRIQSTTNPQVVVLVDPAKLDANSVSEVIDICNELPIPFLFIGGSLVNDFLDSYIITLRKYTSKPLVLFPGNLMQLSRHADALLLLSLISGRNPDFLIGNHVHASLYIKQTGVEVIPTGYMLIDGGSFTSVQYMSQTLPIPSDKTDIVVATAVAAELLGLKLIYLEAGSGAKNPVSPALVAEVRKNVGLPIVVGGGIRQVHEIENLAKAGAQLIVLGNSIENNPNRLKEIFSELRW